MKPILLVPMAGKGQRFINQGYTTPKQFIDIGGKSMIEWSFKSFDWENCDVIFIVRRDSIDEYNADQKLRSIFGDNIRIVVAEQDTDGTVCSCLLARDYINKDVPLGITTLDVYFEPKYILSNLDTSLDGCLLTIETDNPAYSYTKIDNSGLVLETAEKQIISTHGNVGYYCFTRGSDFVKYAEIMIEENIRSKNEFYVAPLYNLLIKDGLKINTQSINNQYHMGTPDELDFFMKTHFDKLNNEIW